MLKRKAYQRLLEWKDSGERGALLVMGARQVGKTTVIRAFGQAEFEHFVEINFYENAAAQSIVSNSPSASDLYLRLSALCGQELGAPNTLRVFDEVQEAADIITSVKFLIERYHLRIILSGSLLGFEGLRDIRSLPVGFLSIHTMFPMDFEEFSWVYGFGGEAWEHVRGRCKAGEPVDDYVHQRLSSLFSPYLLTGGMPEAVQTFLDCHEVVPLRRVQQKILQLYQEDIVKYVPDRMESRQIRMVFDAIPSQLNSPTKRFKYTRLGKNLRFANMETAFDWLEVAGVALPAWRVSAAEFPLGMWQDRSAMKLFQNDVGLLTSQLTGAVDLELLNGNSAVNFGSVYENFVAQELLASGVALNYFSSKALGEVDFILESRQTGAVLPLEVKSGKDYKRHSALNNLLEKQQTCERAVVLHNGNVQAEGRRVYLPVYAAGSVQDQLPGR